MPTSSALRWPASPSCPPFLPVLPPAAYTGNLIPHSYLILASCLPSEECGAPWPMAARFPPLTAAHLTAPLLEASLLSAPCHSRPTLPQAFPRTPPWTSPPLSVLSGRLMAAFLLTALLMAACLMAACFRPPAFPCTLPWPRPWSSPPLSCPWILSFLSGLRPLHLLVCPAATLPLGLLWPLGKTCPALGRVRTSIGRSRKSP